MSWIQDHELRPGRALFHRQGGPLRPSPAVPPREHGPLRRRIVPETAPVVRLVRPPPRDGGVGKQRPSGGNRGQENPDRREGRDLARAGRHRSLFAPLLRIRGSKRRLDGPRLRLSDEVGVRPGHGWKYRSHRRAGPGRSPGVHDGARVRRWPPQRGDDAPRVPGDSLRPNIGNGTRTSGTGLPAYPPARKGGVRRRGPLPRELQPPSRPRGQDVSRRLHRLPVHPLGRIEERRRPWGIPPCLDAGHGQHRHGAPRRGEHRDRPCAP